MRNTLPRHVSVVSLSNAYLDAIKDGDDPHKGTLGPVHYNFRQVLSKRRTNAHIFEPLLDERPDISHHQVVDIELLEAGDLKN